METVEVIGLLSSPEPEGRHPKSLPNAKTKPAPSAALPSRKPLARNAPQGTRVQGGQETDDWYCISDDPDDGSQLLAPVGPKRARDVDHMGKPPPLNMKSARVGSFDHMGIPPSLNMNSTGVESSDHMGIPPSLNMNSTSVRSLANFTTSGLNGGVSLMLGSSKSRSKAKGEEDFFFLSDDFDTTLNVDDPFRLSPEPPPKKRRVTPEPDFMKSTYSARENGKAIARSWSDVVASTTKSVNGMGKPIGLKRSRTSVLDDDPIIFSSSPDAFQAARDRRDKAKRMKQQDLDACDDLFQTRESGKMASAAAQCNGEDGSPRSSSELELPDIGAMPSDPSTFPSLSRADSKRTLAAYQSQKMSREASQSATLQKQREKARKAQEKAELKEAEKERKRVVREGKMKDKEMAADLAKVNTLRIDKKVSTPAMIVDLPADLDERLAGQVRQFLGPLEVECKEWNNPIPNIVKWRRKVDSIYNEEMGHWEPAQKQIKNEEHVLCVMPAKEFVDLSMAEEGQDLDAHVLCMKVRFVHCSIIFLIEGLPAWMRKNRNIKNRQFTEAVRSQMAKANEEAAAGQSSRKGKGKAQQEYVDEDMIEDSLLRLQVIHGAQIHHTTATVDTAQWIMVFTQHISTIPYRLQRMTLDTAFCMESGQVKTGTDPADTFVKMLQEINRITAPIAYGIAAEYPTARALVRGFESEGRDMLQALKKSANKDGAFTDREVGRKISRRLWGIFMGGDPSSTEI